MQSIIVHWNYLPINRPKNLSHVQIRTAIQQAAMQWNECLRGLVLFIEGCGNLQARFAFDAKIDKQTHPQRIGECRDFSNPKSWEISFDSRERWNIGGCRKLLGIGYDLRSTALHEFGHIIDLPHALRYDFIMHKDYNEQIKLNKDEIRSYREHYIVMNDFA